MYPSFKSKRKFFIFPLVALAFVLAAGFAVMYLWNAILPVVIPAIGVLSYKQAIGLLILCRLLFGGFRGRGGMGPGYKGGPPWRQKMMHLSDAEKEKLREQWKQRCG